MNKISNQKGLRQRSFEIIRKPDLIGSSFLFNNVRGAYVGTNPENNISFYANNGQGGVVGVRVHPDGRKVLKNATSKNNGNKYCHSNDDYLQFKHAFGRGKHILASHAVYIAWSKQDPQTEGPNMPAQHLYEEIPAGMTIDHIDGCTTNNDVRNLRCISNAINNRDGGFLRKLRKYGFNPATIQRPYLLRYFDRMAFIKENITRWRYDCLDKEDLEILLYYTNQAAALRFYQKYNLQLTFRPSTGMGSPTQLAKVVMGRALGCSRQTGKTATGKKA